MKTAIAGIPRSGKTTFANEMQVFTGAQIFPTDDLIERFRWSEQAIEAAKWFDREGNIIIEGVTVPRALRKWLENNHTGKPCDKLIWMKKAKTPLTKGQTTMAKGCLKVLDEISDELIKRGVEIIEQ